MPPNVITMISNPYNIVELLRQADLVVGAVLIPGAKAPKLIRRDDLKVMKNRAVLVDVAIDQGGCAETSRPTTHSNPIYIEENIVHYCVANMPGAVGTTSTLGLTNVTLPYALEIASKGWKRRRGRTPPCRRGEPGGGPGDLPRRRGGLQFAPRSGRKSSCGLKRGRIAPIIAAIPGRRRR